MTLSSLLESDPAVYDVQTSAAGPAGRLPLTEEMLREAPSGDLFGWTQDVGMGWNPAELNRREFLLLSTSGGIRNPDGTPVALGYHTGHWEVGLLMQGRGRGAEGARLHPVRRLLHRPLRRPHAGHRRHDGQPAVPQRRGDGAAPADPLAADAARRDRRGHLRQGPAGDDDGPGRHARSAVRPRPRRRDAAAERRRGRGQGPDDRRPLRARPDHPGTGGGAGLPGVRLARRRLPVPRHRGHVAGRRPRRWACACRTPPWPRPASRSGSTWPAARRGPSPSWSDARSTYGTSSPTPRCATRWRSTRPSAADEPAAAHPRHRLPRGPATADGRGLDRRQPADAAAGGRPAERPGRPSDRARLPGRRRAGGDAAPAPARPARRDLPDGHRRAARRRARLVGEVGAPPAAARRAAGEGRHRSRRRDHEPRAGAGARPDHDGDVPARQPGAGRLGHQEHGHRPAAWWTPTASTARRPGPRVHHREGGRSRRSRAAARTASSPATCWC